MRMRSVIKTVALATVLLVVFAGISLASPQASDQSATQDMKDAGHSTKQAAKKTGRKVKRKTKRAAHKAARKTREGAEKVEDKTAPPPQ
jgi:flagellum-specific peptidoglycan hydrolase FlgJ